LPDIENIENNSLICDLIHKKIRTENEIIEKIISMANTELHQNKEKILHSEKRIKFMKEYLEKVDEKYGNHIC
jgi:hypothetical protein